jgi:hypothetical protein
VRASLRIAAIAALAAFASTSTFADVPVWRVVKGDYSEHKILVDPRIIDDPRLAFLLEARLKYAEDEVRDHEQFARDAIREKTLSSPREDVEETLHLIGMTDRYAAILTAEAQCSGICGSAEYVVIYQLSGQIPFKNADVVEFNGQAALLNRLAERDKDLKIGPYSIACDQSDADSDNADEARCLSLTEMLDSVVGSNGDDDKVRFESLQAIRQFADNINVGFTTDAGGRVITLDIYIISARRFSSHYEAYRWPIDAKLVAPLLKPAFRELVADSGASAK